VKFGAASGALATTGTDTTQPLLIAGLVAVVVGSVALVGTRRRGNTRKNISAASVTA
jgi:LPXTG-motif cell wall-anchored protein